MKDEGKYLQLWMKYDSVIRLLLKKTDNGNQKLQMYKHEFESGGSRDKSGYSFSFEIINGKPSKQINATAVARDLVQIMGNNNETKTWLKERSVKVSMGKSFELHFEKVEPQAAL